VNKILSITIFHDPQGGSRGQLMAGLCKLKKNILWAQAAVSLMLLSKNLLFMKLGSQGNMYKSKLGKMGPLTIALYTLSSNISAPKQKI